MENFKYFSKIREINGYLFSVHYGFNFRINSSILIKYGMLPIGLYLCKISREGGVIRIQITLVPYLLDQKLWVLLINFDCCVQTFQPIIFKGVILFIMILDVY